MSLVPVLVFIEFGVLGSLIEECWEKGFAFGWRLSDEDLRRVQPAAAAHEARQDVLCGASRAESS